MFVQVLLFTVFVIASIVNISGIAKDNKLIANISKPLLMPSLLLFYTCSTQNPNVFIILALIAGFFGDVFLMKTGPFFTAGLVSFLIGHAFYIAALLGQVSLERLPLWFYILLLPYVLYGALIYKKLMPALKTMKLPVLIYLMIILTMSFASLVRVWDVNNYSFTLPFIGSLLFISSDSLLSFNTFRGSFKWREVIVMITYIAGQFLIVAGFLKF